MVRATRSFGGALSRTMSGCLLVLVLVGIWYLTLAPSRFGGPVTPVLVRGISMEPTLHSGDLVLAYRGTPEPGDVVVYRHVDGATVIHRLIADDGTTMVTQGDNVPAPDPWTVRSDDVLGVARLTVPGFGPRIRWLTHPATSAALAGLVAFVVVLIPPSAGRNRTGRRGAGREGRHSLAVGLLMVALVVGPVAGAAAFLEIVSMPLTSFSVAGDQVCTYVVGSNSTQCGGNGNGNGNGGGNGGGKPPAPPGRV